MGSLMAGWSSHIPDPKAVKYQRNRSLTKEEIDTYWRSKNEREEQLKSVSNLSHDNQENILKESERRYQRSRSVPLADTKENFVDAETEENNEKPILKNGWWISSKWAFLNEPPVIESEGSRNKYASQLHVAVMDSSNPHSSSGT